MVAALVAALVLGKRRGFPQTPMPPHSLVITVIGASMLWVGWFGFNAGSALAADGVAGLPEGVSMAGQVWVQFVGVIATGAWTAVASFVILKVLDSMIGLRVDADQETEGLDIVLHDERGYNL
jgi:ammonia channel protein AmtB